MVLWQNIRQKQLKQIRACWTHSSMTQSILGWMSDNGEHEAVDCIAHDLGSRDKRWDSAHILSFPFYPVCVPSPRMQLSMFSICLLLPSLSRDAFTDTPASVSARWFQTSQAGNQEWVWRLLCPFFAVSRWQVAVLVSALLHGYLRF